MKQEYLWPFKFWLLCFDLFYSALIFFIKFLCTMAKMLSKMEVLNLVFDDDYFDEHDIEDEFKGDVDDSEIERIIRHNECDYDKDILDT